MPLARGSAAIAIASVLESAARAPAIIKEREALDRILVQRVRVRAGMRESSARGPAVAVQQAAAIYRLVKPLVRIKRERVGFCKAVKFLRRGDGGQSAISAINVEPRVVSASDTGDFSKGVNRSSVHGAGRSHDCDRHAPSR